MTTRKYQRSDKPALEAIFKRMNMPYELPDLDSNNFIARRVLVDAEGRPLMALGARVTTEMYMLIDPDWDETPGWKMVRFEQMHEAMRRELLEKGITDTHAWLPDDKARNFGRRMMRQFGWSRPLWTDFTRDLALRPLR